jgi:hypothetical protein
MISACCRFTRRRFYDFDFIFFGFGGYSAAAPILRNLRKKPNLHKFNRLYTEAEAVAKFF